MTDFIFYTSASVIFTGIQSHKKIKKEAILTPSLSHILFSICRLSNEILTSNGDLYHLNTEATKENLRLCTITG